MKENKITYLKNYHLVIPVLLIAIYSMLSIYAFTNPRGFYEVMEIPFPAHEFFIQSWVGKNTAMLFVLLVATASKRKFVMYTSMFMLIVGQFGDALAGYRTGVNVFITYIAFGLVLAQLILMNFTTKK